MDDYHYLYKHRAVWQKKKVLRRLYHEQFYRRLLANCVPGGCNVEIGSGPGFLEEYAPSVWRTDILPSPWIHCAADAHTLPFPDASIDNVMGLDVLHHFRRPVLVLREVARVLRPGGHLVLVEPWITFFSRFIYTYLHQEECDLHIQPWQETSDLFQTEKQAFDGNAAIPYLLVTRGREVLAEILPSLQLRSLEPFSLFTYLLSLGFKRGSLLPDFVYPLLYRVEQFSRPLWAQLAALRVTLVWEKTIKRKDSSW